MVRQRQRMHRSVVGVGQQYEYASPSHITRIQLQPLVLINYRVRPALPYKRQVQPYFLQNFQTVFHTHQRTSIKQNYSIRNK